MANEWAGLHSVVMVERTYRLWHKTTHDIQFYLSSLPPRTSSTATAIRQHWGIENGLHWSLDVTFGEDASRVRSLHAPHNSSLLRRFAINMLNCVADKQSLRQKSKRVDMDDSFMLRVLAAALPAPSENLNPACQ